MDEQEKKWIKTTIKIIVGIVAVLILVPFTIIGAGERGVVLRMGAVNRVIEPGLRLKIPLFIESVIKVDVKTLKEQVEASAASKDLQTVTTVVALNYNLSPDKVGILYANIGSQYKERIIDPAIQEAIKAATAKYTAEELITKRELVREDMKLVLIDRLQREYITVTEVSIVNFDFSPSFNAAIEAKVTAEQNALASKNKLEQSKYEAEQRIAQAKGEAEAIKIQAQAINSQGGADYVALKTVEKWDGHLPTQMIPGGSIPFLNLNK